jgi:hypothetical protein
MTIIRALVVVGLFAAVQCSASEPRFVLAQPGNLSHSSLNGGRNGGDEPPLFVCADPAASVQVRADGEGAIQARGGRPIPFRIDVAEHVARMWCARVGASFILLWEDRAKLDGSSGVCRIGDGGAADWCAEVQTVGLGEPAIIGQDLYVTGFGFVGRLDIASGHFVWVHAGVYRPDRYSSFLKPRIESGRAVFPDAHGKGALVVDVSSGQIVGGAPGTYVRPK